MKSRKLMTEQQVVDMAHEQCALGWETIAPNRRRKWTPRVAYALGGGVTARHLNRRYEEFRDMQVTRAYMLGLKRGYRAQ